MRLKMTVVVAALGCGLAACNQPTEPPSERGTDITPVQIAQLSTDRTLTGQRVAVVGYPMLCSARMGFRQDEPVTVEVHEAHDCDSPKLLDATLMMGSVAAAQPGLAASGPRKRNMIMADGEFSNDTVTFLTDDYQVIEAKAPVRVAGVVTYPYDDVIAPLLESVSLLKPDA